MALLAALAVTGVIALLGASSRTPPVSLASRVAAGSGGGSGGDSGPLARYRGVWSALGGVGAWAFLGGLPGLVAGVVTAALVWRIAVRAEPPGRRRRREQAARELPHLVGLLAVALASGAAPSTALAVVAAALPGPAADRVRPVLARLRWGVDPAQAWAELARDPELGPLGATLARAHRTGASVVPGIERLAEQLAASGRAATEERARQVGVKAAVPLGLCLLPAFVLIGIVPLVAALLAGLAW